MKIMMTTMETATLINMTTMRYADNGENTDIHNNNDNSDEGDQEAQ